MSHFVGHRHGQLVIGEVVIDEDLCVGRVVEPVERGGGLLEVDRERGRRWGSVPGPAWGELAAWFRRDPTATPAASAAVAAGQNDASGWQASNTMAGPDGAAPPQPSPEAQTARPIRAASAASGRSR